MKVTALIPNDVVQAVRMKTKGKNITEALLIALKDWLALKNLETLNEEIRLRPLKFSKGFSAAKVRQLNRRR